MRCTSLVASDVRHQGLELHTMYAQYKGDHPLLGTILD